MTVPGFNTELHPTSTQSANIAPNFLSPVGISSLPSFTITSVLSDFTLEVIEPAPYENVFQEYCRQHSCNAEPEQH